MELAGVSSVAQAWQNLIPSYATGKAIAIKVNFNNCRWCESSELAIDALIQPINAIVRGLDQAYSSFDRRDIWVLEATVGLNSPVSHRQIPQRFKNGSLYSDVRFFDLDCSETAGYSSTDPTAAIEWHPPAGIPTPSAAQVSDVLVNAAYVINMPIMKAHVGAGVTLSFKNHCGSIARPDLLHDWILTSGTYFSGTSYNPLVDIYRNEHISSKTVLTIGDGLFGNYKDNIGKPSPWTTFGNEAPNSLFFSTDPVAVDCVLCDVLNAERTVSDMSDDYLVYAASVGLGTYERGDPWGSGYAQINYVRINL
jgi:hypothetical protein